jgi:hypothetical protein
VRSIPLIDPSRVHSAYSSAPIRIFGIFLHACRSLGGEFYFAEHHTILFFKKTYPLPLTPDYLFSPDAQELKPDIAGQCNRLSPREKRTGGFSQSSAIDRTIL